MVQHIIRNHINQGQIDMLRSIKGASSLNLYIDEVGEFALNIVFESADRKISIKNTPFYGSDGDEYPKLFIEQILELSSDCKLTYVGERVEDIFILKDVATWRRNENEWKLEADIGIKIVFPKEEFLLLAKDSLAGFLEFFRIKKMTPVEEILKDYWSMKTDNVDYLIREEMNI